MKSLKKYEIPEINNEIPKRVPDLLAYLSPKNPEKNVVDMLVILPAKFTLPYVVEFRFKDCLMFGNKVTFKAET